MIIREEIGKLREGDKVLCSDGVYREFELQEIHTPTQMYLFITDKGSVKCSGDHLWTFFVSGGDVTMETKKLHELEISGWDVGREGGPKLVKIEEVEVEDVVCIQIDTEDHLFEVFTDEGEPILTHNCGFRGVAGRVGSIASLMALGSTLGTTVDTSKPGRGIIQAQGQNERVQYYFEEHNWIEKYYADRGLDEKGWPMTKEQMLAPKKEKKAKKSPEVALNDLPFAEDAGDDLVVDFGDFEPEQAEDRELRIDEMNISVKLEGDGGPVGNVEL